MRFQDLPIKSKVMAVILLTTVSVLILTTVTFIYYDFVTHRRRMAESLATAAAITTENSSAALAFRVEDDAQRTLDALRADPHIVAAALYDEQGALFVRYPLTQPTGVFPQIVGQSGARFEGGYLIYFKPVIEGETRHGTLYLKSDLGALYARLRLYAEIAAMVLLSATLVAAGISNVLQRQITGPVSALVEAARTVSERADYTVRAPSMGGDELGVLTDAFNQMLKRIQEQTIALRQGEEQLRRALEASQTGTWDWDLKTNRMVWDDKMHSLFGLKPGAFGGSYDNFMNLVHPDDRTAAADAIRQSLELRLEYNHEFRVIRPDGTNRYLLTRGKALYGENGQAVRMAGVCADVTERRQAEEIRSFLAAIVDSSDDAIIGKDLSGRIVSWNIGAERMFGYSAEEIEGQSIMRLISPENPEEEERVLNEIRRGGIYHYETVRIRKDASPIEISISVSPIKSRTGELIGVASIARDITDRNRAQRLLRKSEAQLRLIWENTLDGMRLVDEAGIIRMVNEAYCRLVDKPREALEGKPLSTIFEAHRAEDVMRRHRERFIDHAVPGHVERELVLWNGRKLTVEVSNSFLDLEGQPPLLVSTFRDITERKRAEQREAAFANLGRSLSVAGSAPAAARVIAETADQLLGWDACSLDMYSAEKDVVEPVINIDTVDGKRLDVAPAYIGQPPSAIARLTLKQGAQLILRQDPLAFSPGAVPFGATDRPSASLMYVPIRLGQKTIGILSIQSYRRDAYTNADLGILQTLSDQCAGALERVRAEEEVRRLNEQLEQRVARRTAELTAANRELEAFTYSVAHDLRAPLRHIDAFTAILREDFHDSLPPEAQRYLDNVRKGSRNMSRLVDDLLNLARLGRQEIHRQPAQLNQLVEEVISDLHRDTEHRHVEWRIQPLPVVECDPGLMKQVFANLLSNSVKYTRPRANALIEVGLSQTNGSTAVFVRDNGVGFDMKYADKLFGVFQRLHRAQEFEGTGVGLATVERIVRKHGGSIWVHAEVDHGATFYFTLPGLDKAAESS